MSVRDRWLGRAFAWALGLLLLGLGTRASADAMELCLEQHGQGQDAREQGKRSLARRLFTACAQSECPPLVQADCARFADELQRYQPWVSFAARDERGRDLPDTMVYVDGELTASQLDGRPHELDPGAHTVRFVHGDRTFETSVLVGEGEKGRIVLATFALTPPPPPSAPPPNAPPQRPRERFGFGPRVVLGSAGVLIAGGAALAIAGLARVPNNCSLGNHECAAPPGDPSLGRAEQAARISDIGWGLMGAGAAALAAGLVWHFLGDRGGKSGERAPKLAPLASPAGAGLVFSRRF